MKKWTMAILLFDLMAGLLFLGLWEKRSGLESEGGAVEVSGQISAKSRGKGTGSADPDKNAAAADDGMRDQAEDAKKIALTFDDGVIVGLSQELLV